MLGLPRLRHRGKRLSLSALFTMALLSGCDFIYGVRREAQLTERPNLGCVQHEIETTPGISDVRYRHYEGGTTLTLRSPATISDSYWYRGPSGSHVLGALQIEWTDPGTLVFTDSLEEMNRKPSQIDVTQSRPVMQLLEQRLESQCGIAGLTSRIKETCTGVQCP